MASMTKTVEVDCDVTIDKDDVIEFIEEHASHHDMKEIAKALNRAGLNMPADKQLEGSLVREMKSEILILAANKYSIQELEQRLGTKFDLI